jgi:hypothetical protein
MTADAAWDEAFSRVESYLRAQRMESRMVIGQVAEDIVVEARARAAEGSRVEPVTLAFQMTLARIGPRSSAVVSAELPSGPELTRSGMSPAPLEFGFIDSDGARFSRQEIWMQARGIVSWLVIFGLFGAVWESSH